MNPNNIPKVNNMFTKRYSQITDDNIMDIFTTNEDTSFNCNTIFDNSLDLTND